MEATIRYRTRYFNRWLERAIEEGIRQVVTLGAGMDMRPHLYATPGVTFYEVEQRARRQPESVRLLRIEILPYRLLRKRLQPRRQCR